jgi:hypothetical protein
MFCPECKAEYRAGFTRCSDCDVDLVQQLEDSEIDEHEDPDYVPISTVQGMLEEGQIRSFLEANGIPTQVAREAVSEEPIALLRDGLGAARILVPRALAGTARDLLRKADKGDLKI